MKFKTKLWKRSEKSFATTIPHIVLLSLDESKRHNVFWEFNEKLGVWTIAVKQNSSSVKKNSHLINSNNSNNNSFKKLKIQDTERTHGDTQ